MLEVNRGAGTEVRDEGRTTPINHADAGAKLGKSLKRVENQRGRVGEVGHLGSANSASMSMHNGTQAQTDPIALSGQEVAELFMYMVPELLLVDPRRYPSRVRVRHVGRSGRRRVRASA